MLVLLPAAAVLAVLGGGLLAVLAHAGDGDRGDGFRHVELPAPKRSDARVATFLAGMVLLSVAIARGYPLFVLPLRHLLFSLDAQVVGVVGAYQQTRFLDPLVMGLVSGSLFLYVLIRRQSFFALAVGLVFVAGYLLATFSLGLLEVAAAAWLAVPANAAYFLFDLGALLTGVATMIGLVATTTYLPARFRIPVQVSRLWPFLVMLLLLLSVVAGAGAVFHFAASVLLSLFPFGGFLMFLALPAIFVVFLLLGLASQRKIRPFPVAGRPPQLDVIMPCYNEEAQIAATLMAIDAAAGEYGGMVRVLVAVDGSTDRSVEIVDQVRRRARFAVVEPVPGPHAGKAGALNRALEAATADIVVRIDADIIVDNGVFKPLPGWFENPIVGCVGAFDLPNFSLPAWYTKGRLFECLFNFGFSRLAYERFDGNNIPGTFQAFRRYEALALGGFVEGMNGEDSDLTFNLGRIGMLSVLDREIVIYEDVPQSLAALVEQRTRWSRAAFHLGFRHLPYNLSEMTPRYLIQLRFLAIKLTSSLRPASLVSALIFFSLLPRTPFDLPRILVLIGGAVVVDLAAVTVLTLYYGFWRFLPWIWLWIPFQAVRKVGILGGIFSLPTRPRLEVRPRHRQTRATAGAHP